uniref:Provisional ortholog of Fc fragment of IgG-binding protein n=1 Tax=Xenopus tropicalis TaxID=8364 RepID=A0A6I8RRU0_XENTR
YKEFAVVTKEPTTVTISLTGSVTFQNRQYRKGSKLTVNLEPYEAVSLQSEDDLTGTKVVSVKPVAVLSGHSCATLKTRCSHVYEQLQPVPVWGSTYLIAPLAYQTSFDLVYITAAQDTLVTYQIDDEKNTFKMSEGDTTEIELKSNAPISISSTEGIQVFLFSAGGRQDTRVFDTFLLGVPDVTSFCTSYQAVGKDTPNNVAYIVAKTSSLQGVTVDKQPLGKANWQNIVGTGYSWGSFLLNSDDRNYMVENTGSTFGLIVVGVSTTNVYGELATCVGSTRQSCSQLKCRKYETCKIVHGQALCIANGEAVCWAWGDPHYHTFDSRNYDFQGTCTYTMSKTCGTDPDLPPFNIETTNENRGSSLVSYISNALVQVYGYNITSYRAEIGIVRVNNQRVQLPVTLKGGNLTLQQSGSLLVLVTDFGLRVFYDWNMLFKIYLPSSFSENVCGLCGNFNNIPGDDLYSQDHVSLDPIAYGQLWKVQGSSSSTCWDDCNGPCKTCSPSDKQKYADPSSCGIIALKENGPFRLCHAAVDPRIYLDNCIYDLCLNDGFQQILCQTLKTYSDACRRENVQVFEWRNATGCNMECLPNSAYKFCGSACSPTCEDPDAPSKCTEPCIETCECNAGFVMIEGKCMPKENCGCLYQGRFLAPNQTFWADTGCKQRCTCDANTRTVTCKKTGCRSGEECVVKNGIQDCYAISYGQCSASGDPHYITYDGLHYNFQGTCQYKLSGLCKQNKGLTDFQVNVRNQNRGSRAVSYVTAVNLTIYSMEIQIRRDYPDQVLVDGLLSNLPLTLSSGRISVFRSGRHCIIQSQLGLRVAFDWDARVAVTIPSSYAGSVCGLCGNFNNQPDDDLMTLDGSITTDSIEFGNSWKVADLPGCSGGAPENCNLTALEKVQRKSKTECGMILDKKGPFRECHSIIPPEDYFQDCIFDMCAYGKRPDISCRLINGYTSACQEAGANIYPWRSEEFCKLPCDDNSHYNVCTSACPSTCLSLASHTTCDIKCQEGCACDDGYVLSGGHCVPLSDCGCTYNGKYYKPEEVFFPEDNCDKKCSCAYGGIVTCSSFSCDPYEECRVEKGVQSCQPVGSSTCSVVGDGSYWTFDNQKYEFYGNCSYILSKSCLPDGSKLTPYVIHLQNQEVVTGGVTKRKVLTLEIQTCVNGILQNLPFDLESGKLRGDHQGLGVVLRADFGLVITSDFSLHVTVPGNYHNYTCGLCGDYNEIPQDDISPADDVVTFADSWKDSNSDMFCGSSELCGGENQTCPICPSNKAKILKGNNYCGILVKSDGPFAACHGTIDPKMYRASCVNSLCDGTGDLCLILQNYVAICQASGVQMNSWRTPSFCPLTCPENSHFESCVDLCTTSCSSLYDTSICPTSCSEGCECDEGYLFQGGQCVPPKQCGCYMSNSYYKVKDITDATDCSQTCTCYSNRGMICEPYSCGPKEVCTIIEGIVGCINVDPCKSVTCRNKESCKVQDGTPVCVPDYTGVCWAWGAPHYQTYDNFNYQFEGTCTYVLTEYIGQDTTLVPFRIEEQKENRGSPIISFIRQIDVFVYGYKISVAKGEYGKVRVNDEIGNTPVTLLNGKISVTFSGSEAILNTDFGLQVTYDYNTKVMVSIPSSYYASTGGLCGNFNQDPDDEKVSSDNKPVESVTEWAKSWKVNVNDSFCWDACEGNCTACDDNMISQYSQDNACGLLNKTINGPFRECLSIINPERFFSNCLYDLCNSGQALNIHCTTLQSYAEMCRSQGVTIYDWRTSSECPFPCPENSHYEVCGTSCPASCFDRNAPNRCTEACVETCQCDDGFILSAGKCVPIESCGCSQNGFYYQPNQEFWNDDKCSVHCKCNPLLGLVECKDSSCKAGERCALVDGVQGCYPEDYTTCVSSGDPHYTTFDGRKYNFMGTCIYQLAGVCSTDPTLTPFQVNVQNEARGKKTVSYTKAVTLQVYGQNITLTRNYPLQILVNGVLKSLPFSFRSNKIKAFMRGEHCFVRTDFDVTVNFNWDNYARVVLPSRYIGAVCGLCGNNNKDPKDDVPVADGDQVPDSFGDAWKVGDVAGCTSGCNGKCPECSETDTLKYKDEKYCGILSKDDGPFKECYGVIDPTPYLTDCVYDSCQYKGYYSAVCDAFALYASRCQEKGVNIEPWRTPTFCPTCPPNSHYEMCGSGCQPTCSGLITSDDCQKSCTEGCYCDSGFLQSGGQCVPFAECGCLYREAYYKKGEEFYPDGDCKQFCQCLENGEVQCQEKTCGANEECMVINGVQACHSTNIGTCGVSASTHYSSFDGLSYNFQGSCSYTLTEVCRGDLRLANFSIVVENGNDNLCFPPQVNGETNALPLTLENKKIRITPEGSNILLQTDFALTVLYSTLGSVQVTVPGDYQEALCGLCGDFNGQSNDDFRLPSGQLADSLEDFGEAWVTNQERSDCGNVCKANCDGCDPLRAAIFARDEACGQILLETGPFAECKALVNVTEYFDHCLFDMCASDGQNQALCASLQAFVAACQAAGANVQPWRTSTFCPPSCPRNSHYDVCAQTCDGSCAAIDLSGSCSERCFEGCECDDGYMFDGKNCVPMEKCGCVYNGRYLSAGDSLLSPDCLQSCTCGNGGVVSCTNASCSDAQYCDLQNGVRACYDKRGTCSIDIEGGLITFDKLSGQVPRSNIFDFASVCNLDLNAWFRLVVITQSCSGNDGFIISAVHAYFQSVTGTVNGRNVAIPAQLSGSLSVFAVDDSIVLKKGEDMVLVMGTNGQLTLNVSPELSGAMCGACGNFNRKISDDLQGPDTKLTDNFRELITSWRSSDFYMW